MQGREVGMSGGTQREEENCNRRVVQAGTLVALNRFYNCSRVLSGRHQRAL
jgi:hypothetical protein